MGKLAACLFVFSAALAAQTAETAYFRAVMLPSNEVPPVNITASGVADLIAHVVRNSSGEIVSGTVDFVVRANFAADVTATGLHIHTGAAGVPGGIVIRTPLTAAANQPLKAGGDIVRLPAQVLESDAGGVAALRGLFQDPSRYYANIHTSDFPGGALRGQLQPAIGTVLIGAMRSANEVPPVDNTSFGTAVVMAVATVDSTGAITSGGTYISTTYRTEDRGTLTGFHIHPAAAGLNGPIAIRAPLPSGTPIDSGGSGVLGPFYTEIDTGAASELAAFRSLFVNPGGTYINLHTNQHPGGVMRAQLRPTDTISFPVLMSSANEPGGATLTATAPSVITLRTLRNEDGSIAAGAVFFDVNYRLPGAAQITGLHIHDGEAGVNRPVSIGLIPQVEPGFASATGFGNYYNWTFGVQNLAVLEDIIKNPENHYVNLHTQTDPGGLVRAQLGAPSNSVATIGGVISASLDRNATTAAPGSLISIFGENLAKVASDLGGWQGRTLPGSLNGTTVTIGGRTAPILYVSNRQINAQAPVDVPAGPQQLVVTNGAGPSATFSVNVAPSAPSIFFSPVAAFLKNSDFSLVSETNPARAGDVVLIYATGLGQTTPAVTTGGLVQPSATLPATTPVTVTVGGRDAQVVSSVAAPGYAGVYQVAVTIPAGVIGNVPVILQQGGARSNSVDMAVR